jgi:hypothetical protein
MKKIFFISLLFITGFLLSSCNSGLKPARGEEEEIIVIADSSEYEAFRHSLEQVFEKTINTPQPEKLFALRRVPFGDLYKYQSRKNIILIAPVNSGSSVSKYIGTLLDPGAKKKIENGEAAFIIKYDFWAANQIVILMSSRTVEDVEYAVLNHGDKFLYALQKLSDKRLKQYVYNSRYENRPLEAKFINKYGWYLFSQVDYVLAMEKPEDNFIWLRRSPDTSMERWLFIHWIDNATPEYLNKDSIITLRNRMTQKYYRTSDDLYYVEIADSNFKPTEVNFEGRYALYTMGLWRMTDLYMGGPFINYTFYDEKTKRLYMLDGSVYAPRYYKRKIIHQVDVILQSFRTKDQLNKDLLEDLLSELN